MPAGRHRRRWLRRAGGGAFSLLLCHCSRDAPSPPRAPAAPAAPAAARETDGLGLIADVAADGEGRLFLLDAAHKQVVVIERDGAQRRLGAPGRGPGELLDPVGLAVYGGRPYVVDRGNQRIQSYAPVVSVPVDFVPEDACFAPDGRLFVLGAREQYLLHEVSLAERRVIRSILHSPASYDELMRPYHASGFLHCGAGAGLTVLPLLRPEILRIPVGDGPVRRIRIPGFRETRVRRLHAGAVVYEAPPGGRTDYASTLVPLDDGRLLVQIGPVAQGASAHEFESLRTFLLSADGRRLQELSASLPRIMLAERDSVVAVHTHPVPAYERLPLSALGLGRAAASPR